MLHTEQLPLPLQLADPWPGFEQFLSTDGGAAVAAVRARTHADASALPLWLGGPAGSGKTHLLGAAMRALADAGLPARLLSLRRLQSADPELLGLEQSQERLLLDDVDAVIGQRHWELSLFTLCNRLHDARLPCLLSSRTPWAALRFAVPDLRSRWALAQQVELLSADDAQRHAILQLHAQARGLELGAPLLDWLDVHYSRDLERLLALLPGLDRLSLSRSRRLTLPLLREYLATLD